MHYFALCLHSKGRPARWVASCSLALSWSSKHQWLRSSRPAADPTNYG